MPVRGGRFPKWPVEDTDWIDDGIYKIILKEVRDEEAGRYGWGFDLAEDEIAKKATARYKSLVEKGFLVR